MDLKLQPLKGPVGGRPIYTRDKASRGATGALGEVRFICGGCSAMVALDLPMGALMSVVFRCNECGALSEIPEPVKAVPA